MLQASESVVMWAVDNLYRQGDTFHLYRWANNMHAHNFTVLTFCDGLAFDGLHTFEYAILHDNLVSKFLDA